MGESDLIELKFKSKDAAASRLVLPNASLSAEHVTMPNGIGYEFAVSGRENYIALHNIILNDGEIFTNSGSSVTKRDLRGKITFVPAGMSVQGWGNLTERRNSFTAIHFGADAIPEPLARSSVWQCEQVYFTDPTLAASLEKLDRALHSGEPFMSLLGETLCDLAIIELVSGQQTPTQSERSRPALKPNDLRRVQDYITTHLADDISLSDLAGVAGLSKFYFCRAYKAATGRTPYRAILQTRIDTARNVLANGASIQAAAAQTGFVNLSQFSRTFKQFAGASPSAFAKP